MSFLFALHLSLDISHLIAKCLIYAMLFFLLFLLYNGAIMLCFLEKKEKKKEEGNLDCQIPSSLCEKLIIITRGGSGSEAPC